MKNITHILSYLAQLFVEREMFQAKVVEKIKISFRVHYTYLIIYLIIYSETVPFVK